MIVSIHQPQYIPWAGYIYKMMSSDVFVLFDTVQYARGFSNRNMIKSAQGPMWLTVPVKSNSTVLFKDTPVLNELDWAERHRKSLTQWYQKARSWPEIESEINSLFGVRSWKSISEVDEAFLRMLIDKLELKTKLVRASDLSVDPAMHIGVEHLIAITRSVGGDRYLSGKGAGSLRYVSQPPFDEAGIELLTYDFVSPVYQQLWGDFVPDLSVIDMIACRGCAGSRALIHDAGSLRAWTGA